MRVRAYMYVYVYVCTCVDVVSASTNTCVRSFDSVFARVLFSVIVRMLACCDCLSIC